MSLAMTVVMQFELILKYFKTAFKDFYVFTGLGLHHIPTSSGGRVGGWVAGYFVKIIIQLFYSLPKVWK